MTAEPADGPSSVQGVAAAGPECTCPGRWHAIDCATVAATQPHVMVNDDREVFYPDGPEDAAYFAREHGARFLNDPHAFTLDGFDPSAFYLAPGTPDGGEQS